MSNGQFQKLEILDCTIRDGGYINNWNFDKKFVREVYRSLSKAGVDFVEIGFRGTEEYFDKNKYGLWRFSPEEAIREVTANINGAKIALMADYNKIELDDFCDAKESLVKLVRVAVHRDNLKGAIDLLEKIKAKGYKVSLNAMGYTNYTENERRDFMDLLKDAKIDYIYIADSYGSLFPDQIKPIFEPLLEISNIIVGFHPHNNLQMAFANTLEAINCGVHIIDSTIYGMGRAAGNLPTEIILSFFERTKKDRYNSIPVLNVIDRYFVSLQKENTWGYQLPSMLSGMFQCHPDYAKALVGLREYTIEDIWKAMEYIKQKNPVGFSKLLLDELINEGIIGGSEKIQIRECLLTDSDRIAHKISAITGKPDVPYINRHKGRDFLVMANGPTLKEFKTKIDQFIAKYDPIILAANYLGGLFKPNYHAFNNKRRMMSYIDMVAPESKLLIGQYIPDEMVREYTAKDYERIYYVDVLNADFSIVEGVVTTNCRTISVLLLGVAMVMGANRIFCVGMDGYVGIDKNNFYFYQEKDEQEDQEMIIERHRRCQRFLEQIDEDLNKRGHEGIHILTPTSYKSFYKGFGNYI